MTQQSVAAPVKRRGNVKSKKFWRDAGFYAAITCIPILQFCVFYIGVNFNSILMSFQSLDTATGQFGFIGFGNYAEFFKMLSSDSIWLTSFKNSSIALLVSLIITQPIAIVFSYYFFKKTIGYKVFRLILFIPSIVSSIVTVAVFTQFVDGAIPQIFRKMLGHPVKGLLGNETTRFGTILFYNIWVAFGSSLLIYSSAMNGISPAIIEAAQIDGVTPVREFVSIVFPMIWPTYVVFFTTNLAGYFSNSLNLYAFYGSWAENDVYTFGYYLFRNAEVYKSTMEGYPLLSAIGICFTLILAPIVLVTRKLMMKYGFSAE